MNSTLRVRLNDDVMPHKEALMCRHCEERSDEAISKRLLLSDAIAALRSQ